MYKGDAVRSGNWNRATLNNGQERQSDSPFQSFSDQSRS
jgi:hypothetical protein